MSSESSEGGGSGIRVNTITPYFMEHNLFRWGGGGGSDFHQRNQSTSDDFLKSVPMGRFPRAADPAIRA